jgi:DNA-binding transcriptional regulator YhcF (GntR family)
MEPTASRLMSLYARPPGYRNVQERTMSKQRDERHIQRALDGVSDAIDRSALNPRSMLPAYVQLALLLRGIIIVRQLAVGSPLPSEPELERRYGVSRDTVRNAVRVLRESGLAETRRGVGHFVAKTPEIREVALAPGARVIVRMPQPGDEDELLGLVVYVVTEPGKPPRIYDTATTVLVLPE